MRYHATRVSGALAETEYWKSRREEAGEPVDRTIDECLADMRRMARADVQLFSVALAPIVVDQRIHMVVTAVAEDKSG